MSVISLEAAKEDFDALMMENIRDEICHAWKDFCPDKARIRSQL